MCDTKYHKIVLLAVCLTMAVPTLLLAQQSPPAEGDETQLLAVLESDAPLFEKGKACQRLAVIGTNASVPVLAKFLGDPEMAHYARTGLEAIPDSSVDDALRDAMGRLEGQLLAGVVGSVGMRRDAKAVEGLIALLGNSDASVAAAAAWALGRIATPDAIDALRESLDGSPTLRVAAADACLTVADTFTAQGKLSEAGAIYDTLRKAELPKHIEIAALLGSLRTQEATRLPLLAECLAAEDQDLFRTALAMAHELPGEEVTSALVAQLSNLAEAAAPEPAAKILTIVKAEYGGADTWVDVTPQVTAMVGGNGLSVTVGNDLAGGDPIRGTRKSLRLVYTIDDERHAVDIPEKETIEIEGHMTPHPRQAQIISVLGDRGDMAALPVVVEAAKSGPWDVRLSAIRVLATLADASAVPVLLETALTAEGEAATAARESLVQLSTEGVDDALVAALKEKTGSPLLVVVELVGRRGIGSAAATLSKLADSDEEQLRTAAIRALGVTVAIEDLSALIDRMVDPKTPDTAVAAKEALTKACLRMPDRDACAAKLLDRMTGTVAVQSDLLDLLGVVGGEKALQGVATQARQGTDEIQDAATRVLGEWMSPDAAPVLLDLAKTGPSKYSIRCLRGYIRIIRQFGLPAEERLAMCREALAAAGRDDEKRLVLDAVTRIASPEALSLVEAHMADAALKEAAIAAAVSIAEKIVDTEPAAVARAMAKAVQTTDSDLAAQAKTLLRRANRKLGES
ncbi:MAG TPA: HEAT repeat domain-containing protein [Thermoguttaceae bacterium]|nr:HEAT repeat domain-containing protein [Thermoguttaceae bacterium]